MEMVFWMLGIGIGVALLVLTAAGGGFWPHAVIAAAISLVIAATAIRTAGAERHLGPAHVTSTALHHMGLVWTWGALALIITYASVLQWREWWHFFMVFVVLAGLALFLSATLQQDMAKGSADASMLKIGRAYLLVIAVAMLVVMVGLLIDGKMVRYWTAAGQRPGSQDWAANNVFFCGAAALALIGGHALWLLRQPGK